MTLYTLTSQKHSTKVPHHLLVTKLQQYGVSCSALQWFASYLSKRYQRVVLDGAFSDWLTVTSGVPQGSILGPLLFPVYMLQLVFLFQVVFVFILFLDIVMHANEVETKENLIFPEIYS